MYFTYLLAATLATTVSAANFVNFVDKACQNWHGVFVPLTASQLKDIVVQNYPAASDIDEASRYLTDQTNCPKNSDNTYRWVTIGPWQDVPAGQQNFGGNIAVVYYKETDTYNACQYVASNVGGGYNGRCR